MIKLQTIVELPTTQIGIHKLDEACLIIGSCFSDNIGSKMKNAGFNVIVNPFGTIYNPFSIANSINRLSSGLSFTEEDCVTMGAGLGLISSFSHHSSFARSTKEEFLDNANSELEKSSAFFKKSNRVIISLGTAWYYRHIKSDTIVSNCLKIDQKEFVRERLSISTIVTLMSAIISHNMDKKFLFTVSPIRHLKDGAIGNQQSKSILILAVEALKEKFPGIVDYFPAYEILMDELRDYRFYAEDLTHPAAITVDYLWEKYQDFALDAEQKEKLLKNEKLYKQSLHRKMLPSL